MTTGHTDPMSCYNCGAVHPVGNMLRLLSDQATINNRDYQFYCSPCARMPVKLRRGPLFDAELIEVETQARLNGDWQDHLTIGQNMTRMKVLGYTMTDASRSEEE